MVEVTQADKEMAQRFAARLSGTGSVAELSQAFARHRIAAEQRARIEGFNEGIEAVAKAYADDVDKWKNVPIRGAMQRQGVRIIRVLAKPMKGQTDAE